MNWSWFVGVLLEWGSIVVLVHGLEEKQRDWSKRYIVLYFVLYELLVNGMYFGVVPEQFSIMNYVLMFAYVKWGCKNTWDRALVLFVMASIILNLLEVILMWFLTYFIGLESGSNSFILPGAGLTFLGCVIFNKLGINRLLRFLDQKEFIYVAIALLSLVLFAPLTVYKIIKEFDVLDYIYICICVVLMWVMASKMQDYKMDMKYRRKYLEGYADVILQMRRRHHTVANQLNAVVGMCEVCHSYEELVERQREYLGKLQNYELPTEAIVLEEPAVVALIYEKLNQAVEKGIEVETSFHCSLVGRHVSDLEWVEILGVLLENAIEALDGYGGRRKLWISVRENEEQRVEVCIANTFRELRQEELEKFCQAGYSTKGDGRGIGLYDVKELVHKHRGELRLGSRKEMGEDMLEIWVIL